MRDVISRIDWHQDYPHLRLWSWIPLNQQELPTDHQEHFEFAFGYLCSIIVQYYYSYPDSIKCTNCSYLLLSLGWWCLSWLHHLLLLHLLWWSLTLHLLLLLHLLLSWWSSLDLFLLSHLLLLHSHLLLSLLHHGHLVWIKVRLNNFAWQVMSAEKNVHVVSVENSSKLLVHLIDIHLWWKWQSLDEKHAVLKSSCIWVLLLLPENLNWLTESCWNETTVRLYKNWNWCWSIHEICNWALFAWVSNCEWCPKRSF